MRVYFFYRRVSPNVSEGTSQDDLKAAFESHGTVTDAYNPGRGFAFITYSSPDEAQAAVEAMNSTHVCGRDIECNIAKPRGASRGDDRLDREVYLSGPALETDLEVTKNWLRQFGPVAMEPLKSERGQGEGIPFAFVTYPVVAQAAAAMAATPPPQPSKSGTRGVAST